jgi:hypothetical protein
MSDLHCWADNDAVDYGEMSETCMLEAGHDGPHEWTPDDQIRVSFPEAPSPEGK